jgi:hypothetical protein
MLKEADLNLAAALRAHDIQVDAIKAGANVSAQLAASALASVSASAGLDYRGGYDHTTSQRSSESYSTEHRHKYCEKECE